jgi:hypothetical protein
MKKEVEESIGIFSLHKSKVHNIDEFEAGEYLIGDLCYMFKDSDWYDFCDVNNDDEYSIFDFKLNDTTNEKGKTYKIYNHSTSYGDGFYGSSIDKYTFPVDSGSIGMIPIELANILGCETNNEASSIYYKINFKRDFEVIFDSFDGTFDFGGRFEIYTGDDEEEEEN